ncbi:DHHW family protein [Butyrivibrio sp. AE3004]|uniref:DHHW family protein n=1 Tax=Butyrivibrio sp. AE3004 TaxID=1506994 RepID=UPI000493DA67|nr:DHHW family protein [Butyrivibrio sp. AE3004]
MGNKELKSKRQDDEEKIRLTDRILVYIICGIMFLFIIAFFAFEKKDFSVNENRTLAKLPVLKFENVKSGSFTEGLENYAADHFPLRDTLMTLMAEAQRLSGRKEINGVYLAKDGSLIEEYDTPKNTQKQIEQFSKLAENVQNAKCRLMLVPTAIEINYDTLPDHVPADKRNAQHRTIEEIYTSMPDSLLTIDAETALKMVNFDKRLYYRTDHHWTTYGAYVGYEAYCKAAGLDTIPLSDYTLTDVSTDFKGTIFSKLNDEYFGTDTITSAAHPDWKISVEYSDTGEVTDTPYNEEYLAQKDKYSYFLNNIHPMVTITNEAVESGGLAIVKDSYANSMVPFLIGHYHTIYIFDTRYYKGGPSKFINEHSEITDVLILYNMNTIDNDTGIGGIF